MREVGVSLGVSFSRQSPILMSVRIGTDARFSSEVRQIVVIGQVVALLWEQEAPDRGSAALKARSQCERFHLTLIN
jgi:hypothetical protein